MGFAGFGEVLEVGLGGRLEVRLGGLVTVVDRNRLLSLFNEEDISLCVCGLRGKEGFC